MLALGWIKTWRLTFEVAPDGWRGETWIVRAVRRADEPMRVEVGAAVRVMPVLLERAPSAKAAKRALRRRLFAALRAQMQRAVPLLPFAARRELARQPS